MRRCPGARIGYVESDDAVYQQALQVLEVEGATLAPVTVGRSFAPGILTYEYERHLNNYLARLPRDAPMKTLSDIIAHNDAHAGAALKFGQTLLLASEAVDLTDPATAAAYEAARDQGVAESQEAVDSVLEADDLDAIVSASATTGTAARAGYPSVSVPAGHAAANRPPVTLVFLGTARSEAQLLALAYDYEQASRAWRSPEEINLSLFPCTSISASGPWGAACPEIPRMSRRPELPALPDRTLVSEPPAHGRRG